MNKATEEMVTRTSAAFRDKFHAEPKHIVLAPGRVNLIGEHVDHCGGLVLPAAIDRHVCFAIGHAQPGTTGAFHAIDPGETLEVPGPGPLRPGASLWANYLLGILAGMRKAGAPGIGFNLAFSSNIPIGAGMSSSAALCCGSAFALDRLYNAGIPKKEIALMGQRAEHQFAGVRCGIMDQYTSVFGESGMALELDCTALEHTCHPAALPGHAWVLFDSCVKHTLLASGYNDRRRETEEGLARLKELFPNVQDFRDCTTEHVEALQGVTSDAVYRRCRYVVGEMQRVRAAVQTLRAQDARSLGSLLCRTHTGLSQDFEVSCPELDHLTARTMEHDGAVGARMMGGGFGGCTINLLRSDQVDRISALVAEGYRATFGREMKVYPVHPSQGIHELPRA